MTHSNHVATTFGLLLVGLGLASCADTGPADKPIPLHSKSLAAAVAGIQASPEFPGFKRVIRNGTEYFCQTGNAIGSRARVAEQCYTREDMKKMEANSRDFFNEAAMSGSHDTLHMDSPR